MQVFKGSQSDAPEGLLLVGHGTRDIVGVAEFLETAAEVSTLVAPRPVEPCFLELAEPPIDVAVARLIERGVRRLTVVPLLLFAAGHARRDIPRAVTAALVDHPEITVRQTSPLGCHPDLVRLSVLRYEEAIAEAGPVLAGSSAVSRADSTLLLLVGRGSNDARATAEMLRFSELRADATPVGRTETCFFAMAEPSFADMLPRTAGLDFSRIVVQPHLLFRGELLSQIGTHVASIAAAHPGQHWLLARHLGPHQALSRTVAEVAAKPDRSGL